MPNSRRQVSAYCHSWSWRLSSLLRVMTHILRRALGFALIPLRIARAARHPGLVPAKELRELADGGYVSTGNDPQFAVYPGLRPITGGWALVKIDVIDSRQPLQPILYAFAGESGSLVSALRLPIIIRGKIRKVVALPAAVRSLRLDPTETAGVQFSIKKVSVRNIGRIGLLRHGFTSLDPLQRKRLVAAVLHRDLGAVKALILHALADEDFGAEYRVWVDQYDTLTPKDHQAIRRNIEQLRWKPLISIVMPVYNPRPKYLRKALDSVRGQLYPNWELCIADDASTNPKIKVVLEEYARRDARIRVAYRSENGHISAATNTAIELVTGEFIALMDNDDALPAHSLYMVADELNRHPDTDLIYTDEDKIDEQDRRHDPHFKTDWNPELFYAQNLIAHMGVYRTSLVRKIGGLRIGFEGSQDYDFVLRFLKNTNASRVRHIPHVLYHWRIFPGVPSFSTNNPDKSIETAHRALSEYFADVDPDAKVVPIEQFPSWWRVQRRLPMPLPRVSLIVPTRDRLDVLKVAIDGLLHETAYDNLEVVIVDNDSVELDTLEYFDSLRGDQRVKILRVEGEFNFALLNNRAAHVATGSILGFINNDVKIIHSTWLGELVAQVSQPNVGAVGAKLYYANETIQHAGVILGVYGVAAHGHRHFPRNSVGYFGRPILVQHVSAVTAACMLVPRHVFEQVGGYDEVNLTIGYNDVDLCLKIREAGYNIVLTPFAELYHLESVSRGANLTPAQVRRDAQERAYMLERWRSVLERDPFYSPNLTVHGENFRLAFPPRAMKPWLNSRKTQLC
jgi:O-antigen biosynthesis protein